MKKNFLFGVFVLAVSIALSGCVARLGSFTVISTKNIDWSRSPEFTRYNRRIIGKDIYHVIVFVPTKMNITIEEAVDKALEQVPGGVALIDVVLKRKFFTIPCIYGNDGFIVEGSVLVDPKLALLSASKSAETKYLLFQPGNNGEFVKNEISEEEYCKRYGSVPASITTNTQAGVAAKNIS
ncbi:MAG: hypothetical protein LBU55_02585 [Elusimicrobiota bacterium]|jgi:hypothetical protein|nr:hypothetical protein [Elusimicrobiota bacterium]